VQRLTSPVLVGREHELGVLIEAADAPTLVMVEGEAGVGKSRLIEEFLAHPKLGRPAYVGRCQQLSEPFPLGPVIDALREVPLASNALSPVVGALRPLLPELAARLPPLPEPLGDPRAERHRLFRAVRELLSALRRCVIVLEDLHWADPATVELVSFLAPQLPREITLVCTYRREDLPEGSPLPGLVGRLPNEIAGAHLELSPLEQGDVRGLVAGILSIEDVSEEFAAYLHEGSGGLPFAVEEILKLLEDREDLVHFDGLWVRRSLEEIEVPTALQDSLTERLRRLGPDAKAVVEAAAVLGTPGTEELLVAVAGRREEDVAHGLAEALAGALLVELSRHRFGFRHVLARQAFESAIPSPLRRRLHRRAAHALETVEPKPFAQLSHHYRAAGDTEAWIRNAELAAEHAAALHDDATAYELLKDAAAATAVPSSTRARLANKLATHAIYGFNHEGAIDSLRRLLGRLIDDETLPREVRGEVRFSLGILLVEAGELAESYAEISRSAEDLADRPELLARARAYLAQPWTSPDATVEEHVGSLDEAVAAAARAGNAELAARVAADRAVTLLSVGDPRGLQAVDEIPEPGTTAGELKQAVRVCNNLADAMVHAGHYQPANAKVGEGLRLSAEAAYAQGATALRITSLELDWLLGNWAGLRDRARSCADEAEEWALIRGAAETILGLVLVAQGEAKSALGLLVPIVDDFLTTPPLVAWAAGGLARIRLAEGKRDAALDAALRALEVVERKCIWAWATDVAPIAVDALLAADRGREAAQLRSRFDEGLRGRDAPAALAALAVCDALLAEAGGDAEQATVAYLTAERAWLALPRPYEAAQSCERAGRCLLAGDRARGQELLGRAKEGFERLGASWDVSRVRRTLRQHGVRPASRRGRKGYGGELSPREAQVAHLASEGHTNREIALTLYLSPKTVEKHLASAMRKLEVSSRAELTGLLEPTAPQLSPSQSPASS
jgi:DNA-binding CsgD family transcriptional regulator/tetratricopeptide (TPR) repeat protein